VAHAFVKELPRGGNAANMGEEERECTPDDESDSSSRDAQLARSREMKDAFGYNGTACVQIAAWACLPPVMSRPWRTAGEARTAGQARTAGRQARTSNKEY